jgi:peptidoglycan-N-acetylglucosamine deacetylase
MIFYDQTMRRKRFLRTNVVFMVLLLLILLLVLIFDTYSETETAGATRSDFNDMEVALTFDDGPDPEQTLAVLKILEEKQVPATFFFIGSEMLRYPDVVKQVDNAGYTVGNHTFSHSENVHSSKERLRFELQTTNQIVEHLTGKSPRFYRSPYLLDFEPANQEFITKYPFIDNHTFPIEHPLNWLGEFGFVGVDAYIDPRDWSINNSDLLVQHVIERTEHGNIILLHDGGPQREATVEALPKIVDELRAQGFTFVSLSELSGVEAYRPTASAHELTVPIFGTIYSQSGPLLLKIGSIVLLFSLLRLLIILASYSLQSPPKPPPYQRGVSVLIPVYNEARNIAATIASVAKSNYGQFEIIVIDDGSTDQTSQVVKRAAKQSGVPVYLVTKVNGGKSSALNVGLEYAKYEVVVTIDGDTFIHPEAIGKLASHFNDERVGAVAGKIRVVHDKTWLSKFQDIEYIVSQGIEKMAFHRLYGSIQVIPGALGAWRRVAVLQAGSYSDDTRVEDQDLTYAIHALGYYIAYEPLAIAYTEVPATIKNFLDQRFRWMFGTLQCLYKYKRYLFSTKRPRLGLVILPYGLVFGFFLIALMPVIDFLLIYSLLTQNWLILTSTLLIMLIDVIYHAFGLLTESGKIKRIVLVPFQRIFYRLALSMVMLRCLYVAVAGTRTYWKTQNRTGTAQELFHKIQPKLVP